jgi:hypothetical protein
MGVAAIFSHNALGLAILDFQFEKIRTEKEYITTQWFKI